MTEYKKTLNLPHTDFPMKANLAQREPDFLRFWYEQDIYGQLRKQRHGKEKFILHDGPPYANGRLHLGHAVNKVLKDIVVKSKNLSGLDAPYVPGWDCHGLPIELNVEKKVGRAGVKISKEEFREKCREYAMSQIDIQRDEFKRLGLLGDWDNPYMTMDHQYEANIVRALGKIIENNHLKRGFKPVHWCLDCRSALAEAEVEYKNKQSPSIDVSFPAIDENKLLKRMQHQKDAGTGNIVVAIWTTTPWTLPANQAVALHPEVEYDLVQFEKNGVVRRALFAKPLLEAAMSRYGVEVFQVVAHCQGKDLVGILLQHPFYDRQVPIVLGEHVTIETGTGCVHTAPGHGQEDYIIAKENNLKIENPVDDRGCFVEQTPLFANEHINKANPKIIEVLKEKKSLLNESLIDHSYPHCWRHKTPVIFRATPQWFIGINGLRKSTMSAIETVKWIPGWGQARITKMMENRPDWCISRQRTWCTPIPLFINKKTQEIHPKTLQLIEEVAQRMEKKGINAWHQLEMSELLGDEASDYYKSEDGLDVWFDSGVSHACVLEHRPELSFPADLYLEGSDQHRGWFNSSLISSIAMREQAPYRQVLTHGFTVDTEGRKMSKSIGNVIPPEKIINTFGADILRLWIAATDYRSDLALSDEILKRMSDAYRRIRNTARFLLANLFDFDPTKHMIAADDMLALDRWAVTRCQQLQEEVQLSYQQYEFHNIYQKVHNFCTLDMGGFYLDIIKDRQYTTAADSLARRSCQTAMYYIIEVLVRWLAPVLSFTSEEIWRYLPGKRESSVFLTTWYQQFPEFKNESLFSDHQWQETITIRDCVNKQLESLRAEGTIGSALAADVILYCSPEKQKLLQKFEDELRFVLITSSAKVAALDNKNDAVATDIEGLFIAVSASGHEKCTRCWHRREDVGSDKEHPELCSRCIINAFGDGEVRKFA